MPGKEVSGGAQKETVRVQTPGADPGPQTVNVIATQRGALKAGLVEAGWRGTVLLSQYSANWMRPADKASASKIEKANSPA